MPPKRKAPAANGRSSKRVASGVSTPVSLVSDDEYGSDGDEYDSSERDAPRKYDS